MRHRVDLVRPGPESLAWLRATVAELQADDRLARVTVVVTSPYLGSAARRALAEGGCANVRTLPLRQLAERIAGPATRRTRGALSGVLEGAAIRAALRASGGVFEGVDHQRSLHDALGALFRELRHEADPLAILAELERRGGVAAAAAAVFRRYLRLIGGFYDVPELARLAADAAEQPDGRWTAELGAVVLYLLPRIDPAEIALLGRIGQHVPVVGGFARVGEALPDRPLVETAEALAAALARPAPAPRLSHGSARPQSPPADLTILSAPDPAEEARQVARGLAADLEAGVPLWRCAVLYGQIEPYGALVRETLDAAGLPWHAAAGRSLTASRAARSLLGLLALPERRFARPSVLEWVADNPLAAPLSAWDRLSRRAQILEGPRQWARRFELLAATLEAEEARAAADDEAAEAAGPKDSALARAIATAVARLAADTRPPRDGAGWDEFVDWTTGLWAGYCKPGLGRLGDEQAAVQAVEAALEDLRTAAALEPTTSLHGFRIALAAALETRRLPDGQPGVGLTLGEIGAVSGAAFDRVYLVGLAEGIFPTRPSLDPLTAADGGADPLRRRERRLEVDRRALLAALAAADGGRVIASYPRSDGGDRAMYPSRWLLDLASRREGRPIYASELPRLFGPERPWLRRIESAYDGVARLADRAGSTTGAAAGHAGGQAAPADLHDLRLAGVVAWCAAGRDLARHPLVARADLPLGRALRAGRARRSRAFTAYDGNLAELTGQSRRMAHAFESGRTSATAIERWAGCPFQYLLANVLRVRTTQRPEDEWTITPRDRGTLVHAILERFFREQQAAGSFESGGAFGPADHARLDALARQELDAWEAQGLTGHPLAWENLSSAILADLHALLDKENEWRREHGLRPSLFERPFGRPDLPDSWPAATLRLVDGRLVAFGGSIDRIDLSPPNIRPRRALVIDYKSGSAKPYEELASDPLMGGRHVQLALYARAVRAALGTETEPIEVTAEYRFVGARSGFKRIPISADRAVEARLEQVVQVVADGVGAGRFMPTPGQPVRGGFESCRYCDFDRVCSTTRDEDFARKHGEVGS